MTEAPQKPTRSKAKTAGIIIGIVIGVSVAGIVVLAFASNLSSYLPLNISREPELPANIFVSGRITTTGFQTIPTNIGFVDLKTHESRTAIVTSNFYSLDLPNGDRSWAVVIAWKGIGGATGTCNTGPLTYNNLMSPSLSSNFEC